MADSSEEIGQDEQPPTSENIKSGMSTVGFGLLSGAAIYFNRDLINTVPQATSLLFAAGFSLTTLTGIFNVVEKEARNQQRDQSNQDNSQATPLLEESPLRRNLGRPRTLAASILLTLGAGTANIVTYEDDNAHAEQSAGVELVEKSDETSKRLENKPVLFKYNVGDESEVVRGLGDIKPSEMRAQLEFGE